MKSSWGLFFLVGGLIMVSFIVGYFVHISFLGFFNVLKCCFLVFKYWFDELLEISFVGCFFSKFYFLSSYVEVYCGNVLIGYVFFFIIFLFFMLFYFYDYDLMNSLSSSFYYSVVSGLSFVCVNSYKVCRSKSNIVSLVVVSFVVPVCIMVFSNIFNVLSSFSCVVCYGVKYFFGDSVKFYVEGNQWYFSFSYNMVSEFSWFSFFKDFVLVTVGVFHGVKFNSLGDLKFIKKFFYNDIFSFDFKFDRSCWKSELVSVYNCLVCFYVYSWSQFRWEFLLGCCCKVFVYKILRKMLNCMLGYFLGIDSSGEVCVCLSLVNFCSSFLALSLFFLYQVYEDLLWFYGGLISSFIVSFCMSCDFSFYIKFVYNCYSSFIFFLSSCNSYWFFISGYVYSYFNSFCCFVLYFFTFCVYCFVIIIFVSCISYDICLVLFSCFFYISDNGYFDGDVSDVCFVFFLDSLVIFFDVYSGFKVYVVFEYSFYGELFGYFEVDVGYFDSVLVIFEDCFGIVLKFFVFSYDVIHSFSVPKFCFKVDMIPGYLNSFSLFGFNWSFYYSFIVFYCSELCGFYHSYMGGYVVFVSYFEFFVFNSWTFVCDYCSGWGDNSLGPGLVEFTEEEMESSNSTGKMPFKIHKTATWDPYVNYKFKKKRLRGSFFFVDFVKSPSVSCFGFKISSKFSRVDSCFFEVNKLSSGKVGVFGNFDKFFVMGVSDCCPSESFKSFSSSFFYFGWFLDSGNYNSKFVVQCVFNNKVKSSSFLYKYDSGCDFFFGYNFRMKCSYSSLLGLKDKEEFFKDLCVKEMYDSLDAVNCYKGVSFDSSVCNMKKEWVKSFLLNYKS